MNPNSGGVGSAVGWLLFPLAPVLLGRAYHESFNQSFLRSDPRDWSWFLWVLLTGPLWGYGFLAGATLNLPDDPGRLGLRSWMARRAVWVGIGPWIGFLLGVGVFHGLVSLSDLANRVAPDFSDRVRSFVNGQPSWVNAVAFRAIVVVVVAILGYGWLFVALAVIRRAKRLGQARRSIERGLAMAIGFVGSLFGSFWAVTEVWRSYFFDPRIVPLLLAASGLLLSSGCTSTASYGEVRRRELFAAMLTAWLLGLAFVWRWWSRRKSSR